MSSDNNNVNKFNAKQSSPSTLFSSPVVTYLLALPAPAPVPVSFMVNSSYYSGITGSIIIIITVQRVHCIRTQ